VDDDPLFRRALRDTLESDGHEVIGEAENGEEALEMLERCKPDVMLLDLSMPGMTGWEVLRMLRDRGKPFPPIIVVSTLNVGDDSLPFFAEIQKGSIDSQHLLCTISAALTGSSTAAPCRRKTRRRKARAERPSRRSNAKDGRPASIA
jgi:CheY-like chemotaxis protein